MKEKVLGLIGRELKLATWVDLATVVGTVTVTLILFAIAAGSAGASVESSSSGFDMSGLFGGGSSAAPTYSFKVVPTIIMFVTLIVIAVINWYGVRVLSKNKAGRIKANEGIAALLKDETLDKYDDGSVLKTYETRYSLFMVITGSIAALSIIVPLVIFIDRLTEL